MHPAFWIGGNINTRALCLYLLIVAAWRRAVLCALAAAVENSSIFPLQTPDPHNTCADITGRKFYYHKLQISNVCDARADILDTSNWDNDSSWIWEQAFFNDFASGMSLTEYEETTARKTGVGPYTVHYDGWGSMAVQTTGNAGTWQMLECDAIGVVTASQAIVGSSLIGVRGAWNDYFDWYGNEYGSGGDYYSSSDAQYLRIKDPPIHTSKMSEISPEEAGLVDWLLGRAYEFKIEWVRALILGWTGPAASVKDGWSTYNQGSSGYRVYPMRTNQCHGERDRVTVKEPQEAPCKGEATETGQGGPALISLIIKHRPFANSDNEGKSVYNAIAGEGSDSYDAFCASLPGSGMKSISIIYEFINASLIVRNHDGTINREEKRAQGYLNHGYSITLGANTRSPLSDGGFRLHSFKKRGASWKDDSVEIK